VIVNTSQRTLRGRDYWGIYWGIPADIFAIPFVFGVVESLGGNQDSQLYVLRSFAMEMALNLAWIAGAGVACACWLRFPAETRSRHARSPQVVALAMLLVVLFPVISLTDDLQAANLPAETEGTARRMLQAAHVSVPVAVNAVGIVAAAICAPTPGAAKAALYRGPTAPVRQIPWLDAAAIRPPPAA
jgi:hypothetical protein